MWMNSLPHLLAGIWLWSLQVPGSLTWWDFVSSAHAFANGNIRVNFIG